MSQPQDDNKVSRRSLLKTAGASAFGTALLNSGLAQAAERSNGEGKVFGPHAVPVPLTVNGNKVTVHVEPATTLVDVLRDELELTGTKIGCDRGACSACTVWIDGEVRASCMTLVMDVRGTDITTIEGLSDGETLHPVQQAFIDHDALQCGFCTPGMIMSCAALKEKKPDCTVDDVKHAISGHLCRCGTYPNIYKAMTEKA